MSKTAALILSATMALIVLAAYAAKTRTSQVETKHADPACCIDNCVSMRADTTYVSVSHYAIDAEGRCWCGMTSDGVLGWVPVPASCRIALP